MTEHGQGQREQGSLRDSGERGLGRRAASAYQGAIEAVLAVVITTGIGYWLDQRLGTAPGFLLAGLVVGFGAFFVRLWRMRGLMTATPEERGEAGGRKDGPGTP
ncbi:MAG TPA: AtpZ/AtpI family protein [Myxococcota bacterium]|jgi:F0F1-type ATP synthase assembly protein I|nr:AtpZ/AtpI family protein [Myxococcota bacterium]